MCPYSPLNPYDKFEQILQVSLLRDTPPEKLLWNQYYYRWQQKDLPSSGKYPPNDGLQADIQGLIEYQVQICGY